MRNDLDRFIRPLWPLLSLTLVVLVVASVGSSLSEVSQRKTVEILINIILVVGLYVFVGNTGVLSFGHMSFMSIGAYTASLVTIPVGMKATLLPDLPDALANLELGPSTGALIAGAVAAVVAMILAVPISRLSGLGASLAMFAVLVIVYQVAIHWDTVTRGSQTMLGVPTNTSVQSAATWAIIAIGLAFGFQRSASGIRVRATRDDEFAARAAGIFIPRSRAVALVLSGFIVGIGGFMYAQFQGAYTPAAFYIHITFLTIAMLVVGGQNSLAGAVLGALLISLARFAFNELEDGFEVGSLAVPGRDGLTDLAVASLILLVLVFRPKGLTNGREIRWPFDPKGSPARGN